VELLATNMLSISPQVNSLRTIHVRIAVRASIG
jgi:hypothetical protein